ADADACRRAGLVDAHHHGADAVLEPDRLQTESEITARDASVRLELGCDALDRGRRYHQHAPRAEHRHAEGFACCVQRNAALMAMAQRDIELDPGVDLAAAQAAPALARE